MAKGYYYTKEQYLNNVKAALLADQLYHKRLQELPVATDPGAATVTNLETLLNDISLLKRVVLIELKKFMLTADASNAADYLQKNNQLSEFIQSSNSFYKSIGKPVLYSYSNFVKSWNEFAKKLSPDLTGIVETSSSPAIEPVQLSLARPQTEAQTVPETEEQTEEMSLPGPSIGYSDVTSGVPYLIDYFEDLIANNRDTSGAKQLKGLDPDGEKYTIDNITAKIRMVPGYEKKSYKEKTKVGDKTNIQRILMDAQNIANQLKTSGSGLKRPSGSGLKKRPRKKNPSNNYFDIIRGEIAAGNDNPKLKRLLRFN